MTLVRDEVGLLPLHLRPEQRVAVVVPRPVDLTPADTSSYVTPALAAAVRAFHPKVDEYLISTAPSADEIGDLVRSLREYELLVLGTVNAYAFASQAEFVRRALGLGVPSVVAALRLPYDAAVIPGARTYVCTYGVLEPSMRALAKALFGAIGFAGSLPVTIPQSIS